MGIEPLIGLSGKKLLMTSVPSDFYLGGKSEKDIRRKAKREWGDGIKDTKLSREGRGAGQELRLTIEGKVLAWPEGSLDRP